MKTHKFKYGCGSSATLSYIPSKGTGTVTYTITLMLYLRTSSFDIRCNGVTGTSYNFRDLTNIANGVQKFNNCVQTILGECQTYTSRYGKLVAAHDWLTKHNCYNPYFPDNSQSSIGDTPWSAFSAIEGNGNRQGPVCEGYSRAFKVLCDAMEIPCILMSDIALREKFEDHMWNYVQMEDGKWYAVDVTWDDPVVNGQYEIVSGRESHDWFLLGSTTEVGKDLTFIESHPEQWVTKFPNDGSIAWDLQPGPELAQTAWSPTIILGKCATPTISYVNGKLKFSCETEGVKFFSAINDDDVKMYDTEEIDLSATYTITVYATKDDYENSDVATATLCWIAQQPATEGITDEDDIMEVKALPILIQSQGSIITFQGAAEGTPIAIYDTSGKKCGTTIAGKDSATVATSLRPGSVAIVKIGEKSIKIVIK